MGVAATLSELSEWTLYCVCLSQRDALGVVTFTDISWNKFLKEAFPQTLCLISQ